MKINDIEILPGQTQLIRLNISKLPTGTLIDIPVYVIRSKKPGPTLLLQGGLHGDEINGIEIVRRLIRKKPFKLVSGSLILIPILNIYGFLHFSRDVPDGKDVNRSFPGNKNGSLASRVTHRFMNDIFPNIDYAVDFHTGGGSKDNVPHIRYTLGQAKSLELARAFGAHYILPSGIIKNSFREQASKKNVPIIVFEGGESLRFNEETIKMGIEGSLRIMNHLQMIKPPNLSLAKETKELSSSKWIRAKRSGLFYPDIHNGSQVQKGQVIGSITDAYGESDHTIKSPLTGCILCINHQPVVNQGDALMRIGLE